jgi:hypothetical protein
MKTATFLTSSCRHCRYYQGQGRRGGMCQQLGVPVQSHWKACVLAIHPFTSTWENLETVVHLEHSLALNCGSNNAALETAPESTHATIKQPAMV